MLIYCIQVPAQRYECDEGSDASDKNMSTDDSYNNWIWKDDEHIPTLTPNPNSIHKLWDEYEFWIGNTKAEKAFSSKEKGNCKYTYHCMRLVWDKVSEMVRSSWNMAAAYNLVYTVYGH